MAHTSQQKVVITGGSDRSLGGAVAEALLQTSPAKIIILNRGTPPAKLTSPVTTFIHVDLADLDSVRRAAKQIQAVTGEIHGLINAAGTMGVPDFELSKDGVERQFAIAHLGHFLLTNLLMGEIERAKGVVVNLTSEAYHLADPEFEDPNFDVSGFPLPVMVPLRAGGCS
jgi:NAD(P)-dependent dehydrogenase (short-subunit alcohol dehydrogenase family)